MTTADQIRALADTGTPLPWLALVGNSWGGRSAAGTTDGYPVGFTGDDPNSGPDAVKIVAAVNALPHIADLIDAFDNVPLDGDPSPEPWEQWWRNLFAARDALVEALGVTPMSDVDLIREAAALMRERANKATFHCQECTEATGDYVACRGDGAADAGHRLPEAPPSVR